MSTIVHFQSLFGTGVGLGLALPAFLELMATLDSRLTKRAQIRLETLKNSGDQTYFKHLGIEINNFRSATQSRYDQQYFFVLLSTGFAVLNAALLGFSAFSPGVTLSFVAAAVLFLIAFAPIILGILTTIRWQSDSRQLRNLLSTTSST